MRGWVCGVVVAVAGGIGGGGNGGGDGRGNVGRGGAIAAGRVVDEGGDGG